MWERPWERSQDGRQGDHTGSFSECAILSRAPGAHAGQRDDLSCIFKGYTGCYVEKRGSWCNAMAITQVGNDGIVERVTKGF
jgi:hypothetical protein